VVYKVRRTADVTRDLDLIEDYLTQTYQGFGDDLEDAAAKALARIREALFYMRSFVTHPHRGTEQPHILPGLRSVTNNRFVYYFEIDELSAEVLILAVYFGGTDHRKQILERLRH
jgi:toxin ParE1/3/4